MSEKLERMEAFFENRLNGYDAHMLDTIEGARDFYPFTARLLPKAEGTRVLDLGCGTGLELEEYLARAPGARVTGVDLSEGMLRALKKKLPDRNIELICGSYFTVPFGENCFDAAVSVESLHHFEPDAKQRLYRKLRSALKDGGYFILTDYFASTPEEEKACFDTLDELKRMQGIARDVLCHWDTPLTVEHEMKLLRGAGFRKAEELSFWGNTHVLRAEK